MMSVMDLICVSSTLHIVPSLIHLYLLTAATTNVARPSARGIVFPAMHFAASLVLSLPAYLSDALRAPLAELLPCRSDVLRGAAGHKKSTACTIAAAGNRWKVWQQHAHWTSSATIGACCAPNTPARACSAVLGGCDLSTHWLCLGSCMCMVAIELCRPVMSSAMWQLWCNL